MQRWLFNRSYCFRSAPFRSWSVLAWIIITIWCAGCSQYSTKTLPVAYHNTTARFNAYLIARDRIRETERAMFKNRQDNYNQPLPILLPIDSTKLGDMKPFVEDAIKKASLIAERHQNSKWLDDGYVLLGKARLYKGEYGNAMEVFKYVNTKGKDEAQKQQALIGLMRAYTEVGDYTNGLNVAEYLRAQPLTKENTRDYYLTKAYLHEQKGEYAIAVALLDATFPFLKKEESTARLHLIAGQLYDLLGKPNQALNHFQQVLKNRPSYEQSFYSTIYSLQGSKGSNQQLSRMLSDRKNVDLRDKIYYTMGVQESRTGNYRQAIAYWRKSIQETTTNTSQIPYTYQEMAKVYFDKLKDYPKAKAYYDSALTQLPQQSAEYTALVNRKKVLDDFVQYQQTIQTEDSLQQLAKMNPAALDRYLDEAIDRRIQQQQQLLARAQAQVANQPATTSDLAPSDRWYLYNPVNISQGRLEFTQRWGNRPLEDNWRRSQKDNSAQPAVAETSAQTGVILTATGPTSLPASALSTAERKAQKDALYATIPFAPEAINQSNQRLESAYYQLGKLYKLGLNQPDKTISTFEVLLNRYPNTAVKPEVYYLLLVSNDQLNQPSTAWKEKLLAEFPNSSYARLVSKSAMPGQVTTHSSSSETKAQQIYAEVYDLYKANKFTEALARTDNAMTALTGSLIEDKMALLRILLIGNVKGPEPYRQALTEFIRDYPASSLLPRVREMQVAAEQPTAKRK